MKEISKDVADQIMSLQNAIEKKTLILEQVLVNFEEKELALKLLRIAAGDPKNLRKLRNVLNTLEREVLPEHA